MNLLKLPSNMSFILRQIASDQDGATMLLTGLGVTAFLGFAGMAVDVGYWQLTQHRMQDAADEAAYAASVNGSSTAAKAVTHGLGFADGVNNVTVTVNNPPLTGSNTSNNSAWE